MRVVLAGGGSAGHVEPALALADALREADSRVSVTCLGTQQGLEARLVPMRGYELEFVPKVPLPRSISPRLLAMPGKLAGAVHTVGEILDRVQADVVVGFGGYVSAPAYLAAKRHHVPAVVHEANPTPGFANRLGAMLTTNVFVNYPDTRLRGAQYIGLPIRRTIAELDRFKLGDEARAHFGLRKDLPVLLVTGGSQGAVSLNQALAGAISSIRNAGVQVLHVTGPKNTSDIQAPRGGQAAPYVAVPYVDRMDLAYAAADFALCRSGAMTCAELTAVGLPAAYVPLPHGNGEQRLNAEPIVERGGGMLVADEELTADWIIRTLLPVLTDIDRVAAMSEAASALGRRDADRALAKAVIDVITRERAARAANAGTEASQARPGQQPQYQSQPEYQQPQAPAQSFDAFSRPAPGQAQQQYPPQPTYPSQPPQLPVRQPGQGPSPSSPGRHRR